MFGFFVLFFFKQKTAYEMRISDWSSDVCSSDLARGTAAVRTSASRRTEGRADNAAARRTATIAGDSPKRRSSIRRAGLWAARQWWLDRKSGGKGKSGSVGV